MFSGPHGVPADRFDRRTLRNNKLQNFDKQRAVLCQTRVHLWHEGTPNEIRTGDFPSCFRPIDDQDAQDPALYNYVTMDQAIPMGIGWANGLEKNISMKIGKTEVLVCDNHDFALGFIIEKFRKGLLKKDSNFIHFDEHDDFELSPFKYDEYVNLTTEKEKVDYIITNARIGGWIRPLKDSGIISDHWVWVYMHEEVHKWCFGDTDKPDKTNNMFDAVKVARDYKLDIVDIDLDVLLPQDMALTQYAKRNVEQRGEVPPEIAEKLQELAAIARGARVVTIATSPGFIVQKRAVYAYLPLLLKYMNNVSNSAG